MKKLLATALAIGVIAAINSPGRAHFKPFPLSKLKFTALQAQVQLNKQSEAPLTPRLKAVESGQILEIGQRGPAIKKVRHMLRKLGYTVASGEHFDNDLAQQIGLFQIRRGLARASQNQLGKIGPSTLQVLNQQVVLADYDPALGQALAQSAKRALSGGQGNCYAYVAHAIHKNTAHFLSGDHAYMAAEQLAANTHFHELDLAQSSLEHLPTGAIVVWEKGKSRSGHISIADGQGNELSDHQRKQMLSHYGGGDARVFLPMERGS